MQTQYKNLRSLLAWSGLAVAGVVMLTSCDGCDSLPTSIVISDDLNPKNQNTYHLPATYTGDFAIRTPSLSIKFTSQDNYAITNVAGCFADGPIHTASVTVEGLDAICSLQSSNSDREFYLYPQVTKQSLVINDSRLNIAVLDANQAVMTTIAPSTTPVTLPVGAKYLKHSAPLPIKVEWQDDYYKAKNHNFGFSTETLYEIPDANSWRVIKINAHVMFYPKTPLQFRPRNQNAYSLGLGSHELKLLSDNTNYYAGDVSPTFTLPGNVTLVHCADPLPRRASCRLQFDAAGIAEMTRQDPLVDEFGYFIVYVRNYP